MCANTTILTDSMLRTGVLGNLLRNKHSALLALDFVLNHVRLNGTDPSDTTKFIHMEDFSTLLTTLSEYPCGVEIIEKVALSTRWKRHEFQFFMFTPDSYSFVVSPKKISPGWK